MPRASYAGRRPRDGERIRGRDSTAAAAELLCLDDPGFEGEHHGSPVKNASAAHQSRHALGDDYRRVVRTDTPPPPRVKISPRILLPWAPDMTSSPCLTCPRSNMIRGRGSVP